METADINTMSGRCFYYCQKKASNKRYFNFHEDSDDFQVLAMATGQQGFYFGS
jgi:hypothetical protein